VFEGILIDEAAQSLEVDAIVPIIQRGCKRLVLVGDHCQLPPTAQCHEAEMRGFTVSLHDRLIKNGLKPFFLDTQFRSHPKLAEFSAEVFYEGRLRSGIQAQDRLPIAGFGWPRRKVPVAFLESGGHARENTRESADGESKWNKEEADRVIAILEEVLMAGDCSPDDIGVVTPYMRQVRLIRQLWWSKCNSQAAAANSKRKSKKKTERNEDTMWWQNPRALEIASVDSFQGREKDLIIFSAVRNNVYGNVGFLADWRRRNVMLTRARRGLFVVGNAWTLKHDQYWCQWLVWCEKHDVIIDKQIWHGIVKKSDG